MNKKPDMLGLIIARGGSKGVPRKNMRLVAGQPLICWTFAAARRSALLTRIMLSTDAAEIADCARRSGVEVPFMRPAELAQDTTTTIDVTLHALQWLRQHENYQPDYVALLQPTTPLRTAADIDAGIRLMLASAGHALVSVTESDNHPFLARQIDAAGALKPFLQTDLANSRRQELPPAYALNGALYVARADILLQEHSWHPKGALAYLMPPERSLDIDSEWSLKLADLILRSRTEEADEAVAVPAL